MIKSILTLIALGVLVPGVSFGTGGAAGSQMAMLQNLVGAGASAGYASQNFAQCRPRRPMPCIRGVMGIMQLLEMLKGAKNSSDSAAALINGAYDQFGFDPSTAGFCTDPTSCSPDAIDTNLAGFTAALKAGTGFAAPIAEMEKNALAKLTEMEKKGFKANLDTGSVTDPSGKTTKASDLNMKLPKSLEKAAADKMAGIQKAMGKTSGNRGVASTGGVVFKDEYVGGLGSNAGFKKKSFKKKDASEFLAGLSDKDAQKSGVGFAGDSIFGMIQRRYNTKMKAKQFMTE